MERARELVLREGEYRGGGVTARLGREAAGRDEGVATAAVGFAAA